MKSHTGGNGSYMVLHGGHKQSSHRVGHESKEIPIMGTIFHPPQYLSDHFTLCHLVYNKETSQEHRRLIHQHNHYYGQFLPYYAHAIMFFFLSILVNININILRTLNHVFVTEEGKTEIRQIHKICLKKVQQYIDLEFTYVLSELPLLIFMLNIIITLGEINSNDKYFVGNHMIICKVVL